jgi:hypothetical protein
MRDTTPESVKKDLQARHVKVANQLAPIAKQSAVSILADAYRQADLALRR